MLRHLRHSFRLVTLLVPALAVGPTASALCPHPGGDLASHCAMQEASCHETSPEPESTACDSPCCTYAPEAPVPVSPVPPAVASALTPPVVSEAPEPAPETDHLGATVEPPGPLLVRAHLLLGRFLT